MHDVTPSVIKMIAAELQDGSVADVRAAELAAEVGRLNAAVRGGVGALKFHDQPADFARMLAAGIP
jgi:hypothetical protein